MKWILSTVLGLGVTFSSSLPVFAQPSCNVKAQQSGILAPESGNPRRLSSRSPNARLASLTLDCSDGMQLRINTPVAQGSTLPASPGVEVWDGSSSGRGTPLRQVTGAGSSETITFTGPFNGRSFFFDLYVDSASGGPLNPDTYTYGLTLTITPQ